MDVVFLTRTPALPAINAAAGIRFACVSTFDRAVERAAASPAPAALLLGADAVDQDLLSAPQRLVSLQSWIPVAVYVCRPDLALIDRVWPLAQTGVSLLYDCADLTSKIRSLAASSPQGLAALIDQRFDLQKARAKQFLHLLETSPSARLESAANLARQLGIGRSALYSALAGDHLPGVEELQLLFRLAGVARLLSRRSNVESAARLGGFSDPRSLRRSAQRHLGLGLKDLRRVSTADLLEHWIRQRGRTWNGNSTSSAAD